MTLESLSGTSSSGSCLTYLHLQPELCNGGDRGVRALREPMVWEGPVEAADWLSECDKEELKLRR